MVEYLLTPGSWFVPMVNHGPVASSLRWDTLQRSLPWVLADLESAFLGFGSVIGRIEMLGVFRSTRMEMVAPYTASPINFFCSQRQVGVSVIMDGTTLLAIIAG